MPHELHAAAERGDGAAVHSLLEAGHDPTLRHVKYNFRPPFDVATSKEARSAFRRYMALHEDQWDWHAAHVPAGLTEEQQAEKEERERAKAKEKKKRAEKAKKERKRAEEEARAQAATQLHGAIAGESVEALTAAMHEAARVGCGNDEVEAARARVDKLLKDAANPEVQKQRQRALRAAAAEARLNGGSAR